MTMANLQNLPIQLDFEGPNNFRELGGYPVGQGKYLQRHRLYRSDHLARLTEADQQRLGQLGIRTVIDLRRESERQDSPNQVADSAIQQLWLPVRAEGADVRKLRRGLETGEITAADADAYLRQANLEFVRRFAGAYARFFEVLLEPANYPIVFHCTAGKDRAGFAAALVLLMCGASQETVFHDYLATNHCTAHYVNGIIDGLEDMPQMKAAPDAIRTLMQVRVEYLQVALEAIDADHGSMEAFFDQALAMDVARRESLRQILCD